MPKQKQTILAAITLSVPIKLFHFLPLGPLRNEEGANVQAIVAPNTDPTTKKKGGATKIFRSDKPILDQEMIMANNAAIAIKTPTDTPVQTMKR